MKYYLLIYLPLFIGYIISNLYKRKDEWYDNLKKINYKKTYVFDIIWTMLYLILGYSYYILLHDKKDLIYWIIPITHLTLNYFFIPILYSFHNLYINLIMMILLLITGFILLYQFYIYDKSKLAIKLFIPYIIWLLFITYLYIYIYINNTNTKKDNFIYYLFYKHI